MSTASNVQYLTKFITINSLFSVNLSVHVWPVEGDVCVHPGSLPHLLVALTQSMMEQSGGPHSEHDPAVRGPHSKRLKELENAALQSTLMSRMEVESGADAGNMTEQQSGEGDHRNGLSVNHCAAPPRLGEDTEAGEMELGGNVAKERLEEDRTLTDHLNKRLLSSFLAKLNERDLALPGVQRLDCAVAEEDSNRAADEW